MSPGSRSREPTKKQHHQKLLMLTQIRQLLKNEFAFDGYMNHGQEDVEMGEWTLQGSLPGVARGWVLVGCYCNLCTVELKS